MRSPRFSRKPAQANDPFALHGAVEERQQPKKARQMGEVLGEAGDGVMRIDRYLARRERQNGMVHLLEGKAVEVDEIAGHVNYCELPLPT
jgi:hypothetical protein